MNPQRATLLGALVLCALSICAFAAASASAVGLTAVECTEVAKETGNYKTSACTTPKVEKSNFETVVIPANVQKAVEGTDTRNKTEAEGGGHGLGETGAQGTTGKPVTVFHVTVGGVQITITCGKGNTTSGILENTEDAVTKEMRVHTEKVVVTWSECHASLKEKPETACKVQGTAPAEPEGSIATNPLTATTEANHKVVVKPEIEKEGVKVFTEFKILKSSTPKCFTASDLPVQVTGEAWGRADTTTHSHLTFDAVSNEGSPLRFNKVAATLTETVTGFTKKAKAEDPAVTVGTETF